MIEKIRLRKKKNEVVKVGDVVNYRGSMFIILNVLAVRVMINRKNGEYIYDQETGIWVQIKAILGYHFEGRNLVVKYEFEPVMELPADEVEKAITKKRKSIMKLVKKNS